MSDQVGIKHYQRLDAARTAIRKLGITPAMHKKGQFSISPTIDRNGNKRKR